MITKDELTKHGYDVLPHGGWIYITPEVLPRDWDDICKDFGLDATQRGAWLAISGVKQDTWDNDEGEEE